MPQDKRQERVTSYVKKDGTRVRSHTRSAHWARAKSTWVGAGFASLTAAGILLEAGVTLVSTLSLLLIAVLGTVAVMAGRYVEHNRKTMARQRRTRRPTRAAGSRTRSTTGRPRASSSRSRAGSRSTSNRTRRQGPPSSSPGRTCQDCGGSGARSTLCPYTGNRIVVCRGCYRQRAADVPSQRRSSTRRF